MRTPAISVRHTHTLTHKLLTGLISMVTFSQCHVATGLGSKRGAVLFACRAKWSSPKIRFFLFSPASLNLIYVSLFSDVSFTFNPHPFTAALTVDEQVRELNKMKYDLKLIHFELTDPLSSFRS